jgi:hypothetical protein
MRPTPIILPSPPTSLTVTHGITAGSFSAPTSELQLQPLQHHHQPPHYVDDHDTSHNNTKGIDATLAANNRGTKAADELSLLSYVDGDSDARDRTSSLVTNNQFT